MSVKRLTYLDDVLAFASERIRTIRKGWSNAEERANRDIVAHIDLASQITKELLRRAKTFQKRDMEVKKK
jgi:hypothetical protein